MFTRLSTNLTREIPRNITWPGAAKPCSRCAVPTGLRLVSIAQVDQANSAGIKMQKQFWFLIILQYGQLLNIMDSCWTSSLKQNKGGLRAKYYQHHEFARHPPPSTLLAAYWQTTINISVRKMLMFPMFNSKFTSSFMVQVPAIHLI